VDWVAVPRALRARRANSSSLSAAVAAQVAVARGHAAAWAARHTSQQVRGPQRSGRPAAMPPTDNGAQLTRRRSTDTTALAARLTHTALLLPRCGRCVGWAQELIEAWLADQPPSTRGAGREPPLGVILQGEQPLGAPPPAVMWERVGAPPLGSVALAVPAHWREGGRQTLELPDEHGRPRY
jgi:hypothetical protein